MNGRQRTGSKMYRSCGGTGLWGDVDAHVEPETILLVHSVCVDGNGV